MIEVILALAATICGAGLYMWAPEGHRKWGVALTVLSGVLFIYAGVLAIRGPLPANTKAPEPPYILADAQIKQLAAAFGNLSYTIAHSPDSWPWGFVVNGQRIGGCRVSVSANSGNEGFRDRIIQIANQNGCTARASVAPSVAPLSVIISSKGAAHFDNALSAMDYETEQFITSLKQPPLSLDVQRGPDKPQDGALHIDLGNNSAR